MVANTVEIRLVVKGEDAGKAISAVHKGVADSGAQMSSVVVKGAKEAEAATGGLMSQVKGLKASFDEGRGGASLFNIAMTAARNPLIGMAIAAGALVVAMKKMQDTLLETVASTRALANVSGLTIEQASALHNAWELMGKDTESLRTAMFRLGSEVDSGGQQLARLGISVRDANGALKTEGALLLEVHDRLSQVGDSSTRNALLMAVFGRAGRELADVMAFSRDELADFLKKGGESLTVTQDMADRAKKLAISQRELADAWQGFTNRLAQTEGATKFNAWLSDQITQLSTYIEKLKSADAGLQDLLSRAAGATARMMFMQPRTMTDAEIAAIRDRGLQAPGASTTVVGKTSAAAILGPAEVAVEEALIKKREQAALQSIALVSAATRTAVAANVLGERQAVEIEIGLIRSRERAELDAIARRTALLNQQFGASKNPAVEKERIALEADAAAARSKANLEREAAAARIAAMNEVNRKLDESLIIEQLLAGEVEDANARKALATKFYATEIEKLHDAEVESATFVEQTSLAITGKFNVALDEAKNRLGELRATLGGSEIEIERNRVAWELSRRTFAELSPDLQQIAADVAKVNVELANTASAKRFNEEMESLAVQAALFGPAFNEGDAALSLLSRRMTELAAKSRGQLTPELIALKTQFDSLRSPAERAAEAIDRVFSDRQREIDAITKVGTAQEKFFQQGLDAWAAQARAAGDYTGFLDAQFTIALTRGKDTWSLLADLGKGLADDLRSSFSSFFTDFAKGLQAGKGIFESFTSALSSLWNSLMNSLIKRFADFLVDMALKAAASSGSEGFLAALFGAAGAVGAAGSVGGGVEQLSGPGVTGTGAVGLGAGPGSTTSNAVSLASSGVGLFRFASTLISSWEAISAVTTTAWTTFNAALATGSTAVEALGSAANAATSTASQALSGVGAAAGPLTAVIAAVTIALTAMRDDLTDTGKAILTSMHAAAAITLIATGWTGIGALVALALETSALLFDWLGIFEKASEEWLAFPGKLSATLGKEQESLTSFGEDLAKATNLTGVAESIEAFRHRIETEAGVGGFFEATKGQGLFHVPGIPGATGNEHEGGIAFNFNPYIQEIQAALDEVLDSVRNTISVKFVDIVKRVLPEELAAAFKTGMIDTLRQQFDDLVSSTTATIDDIKAFEERMKAVGELISGFAQAALMIRETRFNAAALVPDVAAGVSAWADILQQKLVDLALTGTATAEDLAAVQEEIKALATGVALLHGVRQMMAALSGDTDAMVAATLASIAAGRAAAARAVVDAQQAAAAATTGPELAAAYSALVKSINDKYDLERKLVQDLESAIGNTLQTVGALYLASAGIGIGAAMAKGDTGPLLKFIATMDDVAASSNSTTLTLWAVVQAFGAVNAAIQPLLLSGASAADVVQGAIDAIAPSVSRLKALYDAALAAGDTQGAMAVLQQGADLITSTHQALVAGIQAMEQAEIARYQRALQVIQTYGGQLASAATGYAVALAELGDLSGIRNVLAGLQEIADGAQSVALKMWAAVSAIQAVIAVIPAGVKLLPTEGGLAPAQLTQAVYSALLGPLTTIQGAYTQAIQGGDFQGALDILGQTATLAQQAASALVQGIRDWESAAVTAAQNAGQAAVEALQQAADLETEKNDKAIDALNAQKDAAQKVLETSRDWARVVDSISKTIVDLKLGTSSPLNPRAALAFAQSQLSIAEAAFAAKATPENALAVQDAIKNVLSAGQNVWTRPSPEWATLFNSMISKLEGVKAAAAARVSPEEQAAASLKSIDDQIKALQDKNKLIADTLKQDIAAANKRTADQITAIHAAANAQVAVVKGDLANVLQAIATEQRNILVQFGPEIDAAANKTEKAIHDSAAALITVINTLYTGVMGWVAGQSEQQLRDALKQQVDLLNKITGNQPVQAFMAQKAQQQLDELKEVNRQLGDILSGIPKAPPPAPPPAAPDAVPFARGKNDGPEAVAPLRNFSPVATRRERDSDGGVMVQVDVHVAPGAFVGLKDGTEAGRKFGEQLKRELRDDTVAIRMLVDRVRKSKN